MKLKQYEAMFLFDPSFAGEYANVEKEIERIMGRASAEVVFSRKWDERKLAYEIKKRKRGCYVLTYFRAPPSKLVDMERDCRLSEHVLRVMITDAEGVSLEQMEKFANMRPSSRGDREGEGEYEGRGRSDRDDDGDRGYGGRGRRPRSEEPEFRMDPEGVEA